MAYNQSNYFFSKNCCIKQRKYFCTSCNKNFCVIGNLMLKLGCFELYEGCLILPRIGFSILHTAFSQRQPQAKLVLDEIIQ